MNISAKRQFNNDQNINPIYKDKLNTKYDLKIVSSEVERRSNNDNNHALYEKLNLIQKVTVSELGRIGYQLHFVRGKFFRTTAILICENNIASVDRKGKVIMNPDIKIRK